MILDDLGRHGSSVILAVALCTILLSLSLWGCSTSGLEVEPGEGASSSGMPAAVSRNDRSQAKRAVSGEEYDLVADFAVVVGEGSLADGTNLWWTDEDADVWIARWAELRPSYVRVPLLHPVLEPQNDNGDPDDINWSGFLFETSIVVPGETPRSLTYRAWFEALRDLPDVNVVLYFPYLAPWLSDNDSLIGFPIPAAPHPPNDLAEYREFVTAVLRYLVESVGLPPARITVEVMNEPDLRCGVDPATACFWDNWTMADIASVVQVTYDAVQSVDADIKLVGLAECCGTAIVRELLDDYPQGYYLDGLSYHYYSPSGYNLDPALSRAAELAPYSRPLYLDEYGSRQFLSEGNEGALWHSWALVTLWEAGIAPLQYPISEYPLIGEPYSSMGLFENWSGDWSRKPSYWVYANFFHHMDGGDVLAHAAPADIDVLTTRRVSDEEVQVAFWVVNRGDTTLADQSFAVRNFPEQEATLFTYDNLAGPTPMLTIAITGSPLVFTATLPARSSHTFILRGESLYGDLDHVVLSPQVAICLAGQSISYTLIANDIYSNSWDVTPSGTYAIDPGAGGTWLDNVYTTEVVGAWTVTGTYVSESDTGSLQVRIPTSWFYLPLILREEDVIP